MKKIVLFCVLCLGCATAQYYDGFDDFGIDDYWEKESDNVVKDIIDEPLVNTNNDAILDGEPKDDKDIVIEDNRFEQQPIETDQEFVEEILNEEQEIAVEVNEKDIIEDIKEPENDHDDTLSQPFDGEPVLSLKSETDLADPNVKEESNKNSGEANLEDIKFEGASIASNQTDLNKIIEETQKNLAEADGSDLENIITFKKDDKSSVQNEDTVDEVSQNPIDNEEKSQPGNINNDSANVNHDVIINQSVDLEQSPSSATNLISVDKTDFKEDRKVEDNNLEDIKFERVPIVSNQSDFDKIMADAQRILDELDSSDMDNTQTSNKDEPNLEPSKDTVAKVTKNLNEDLANLYNTWEKLKPEDEDEVPDIFKDIKSQENVNNNDMVELDENDKEHFDEVDFETLFNDLNKDIDNAGNKPYQELEKNIKKKSSNDLVPLGDATANKDDEQQSNQEALTTKKISVEDLTSSEFADLLEQFKQVYADDFELDKLRDSNPTIIHLDKTNIVTITSPNYPNPYPTNQIFDWMIEGEGTGIELNITDLAVNGALGDYVLFKPGGIDETGNQGIIMTYQLNRERKFRFGNVNKMFVRFEAKQGMAFRKGFSFNVKMIFPPKNETADVDPRPPSTVLPPARHTHTVYLAGAPINDFKAMEEEFRILVADMATVYVHENGIEAQNETSSVTRITATAFCPINWPGFEHCVSVTFTVPLDVRADEDWRLNEDDLRKMWGYVYGDPFAARLKRMGFEEFQVPNDGAVLMWWITTSAAVACCVLGLGILLWRFSCVEDYTRMRIFSDTDSFSNDKRPLDLYPTPHQTLPPLYGDVDYSWAAEKGADSTVDMSGYPNPNFVRDDLLDFESDDEPVRDRNGNRRGAGATKDKHIV